MPVKEIFYSEAYKDDVYEYRHVILPPEQAQLVPRTHLLTETEWRNLGEQTGSAFASHEFHFLVVGLQMSAGWVHFMLHNPG
jgi:cyclin-dependent kinase regulatory subunit CKS1